MKRPFPFLWNPSVGLEIGEHSVRVVTLDRWFKRIRVVCFGETLFSDKEETPETKIQAIRRLYESLGIRSNDVCIHVSGKGLRHILQIVPEEALQNMESSVKRVLSEHLPPGVTLAEVVYGYRILGKAEKGIRILISYCRPAVIDALNGFVEKAGLNPVHIGAGPFDLLTALIVTDPALLKQTFCILDCGNDLHQLFFLQRGNCVDYQTIPASTATDQIPHVFTNFENKEKVSIAAILISGEQAERCYEILNSQSWPWPVRLAEPLKQEGDPALDARYTLTAGLALESYYPQLCSINLQSHVVQKKNQERRDKKTASRILLGLGGLLCLFMAILNLWIARLQSKQADSEERVLLMQDRIVTAEMAQKDHKRLRRQLKDMERLLTHRSRASEILEEISRIIPQSVWLSEMRFGAPKNEAIKETADNLLRLSGWSLAEEPLTQLVANLEASPVVKQVQIREIQKIRAEEVSKLTKGINRPIQTFSIEVVLTDPYVLN